MSGLFGTGLNRRFRAGELSLGEVAANLAPFKPHVEIPPQGNGPVGVVPSRAPAGSTTSPEGIASGDGLGERLPKRHLFGPDAPSGDTTSDIRRAQAVDALHTYIVEEAGYDHRAAMTILRRVTHVLDTHLAAHEQRAEQDIR